MNCLRCNKKWYPEVTLPCETGLCDECRSSESAYPIYLTDPQIDSLYLIIYNQMLNVGYRIEKEVWYEIIKKIKPGEPLSIENALALYWGRINHTKIEKIRKSAQIKTLYDLGQLGNSCIKFQGISKKTVEDIKDLCEYFNVEFKNNSGKYISMIMKTGAKVRSDYPII